jgi:hypothetical protein
MSASRQTEHLDGDTLAALAMGEPDAAARAHVEGCEACRRELAANERVLRELDALPLPRPAEGALERVRLAVIDEMSAGSRRAPRREAGAIDAVTAGVVAVVGAIALWALADFSALATVDGADVARWALALAALGGAVAIGLFAPRSMAAAGRGLAAALGGAAALAVIDLMVVPPGVGEHLGCEYVLMLVASAPLLTAVLSARRRVADGASAVEATLQAAAGAGAGALAGQAALFTTCSSPEGLLHVAVFHVLTFVGIVAVGALLGRATHLLARPA